MISSVTSTQDYIYAEIMEINKLAKRRGGAQRCKVGAIPLITCDSLACNH